MTSPVAANTSALQLLTAAAFALPGLAALPVQAEAIDEAGFHYGHYEESTRRLEGVRNGGHPISVDSVGGNASLSIRDNLGFRFDYEQDTWSGATPIATAPAAAYGNNAVVSGASPLLQPGGALYLDKARNIIPADIFGQLQKSPNNRVVHTLSTASPETRKQGDFQLGYQWDRGEMDLGGGVSQESDYDARWGRIRSRFDFNQKLTSLNLGMRYETADIRAILDHDATPYITDVSILGPGNPDLIGPTPWQEGRIEYVRLNPATGLTQVVASGDRSDLRLDLGLTRILTRHSQGALGMAYVRSQGFLENPYKVVQAVFINPREQFMPGVDTGGLHALLERRPDERNQWSWDVRYAHYLPALHAAAHLEYRLNADDWGITAHTVGGSWDQSLGARWTLSPRVRYYAQGAADFYTHYLVSMQAAFTQNVLCDANGANCKVPTTPYDTSKLPRNFSSDHRLSGFGAISTGAVLTFAVSRAITFETGFEYYSHQGKLKLGAGGEADFADFDFWQASGALRIDLASAFANAGEVVSGPGMGAASGLRASSDDGHAHHADAHSSHATPAGVTLAHMGNGPGQFMLGYRHVQQDMGGESVEGGAGVQQDAAQIARACPGGACKLTPVEHRMSMHMVDAGYSPARWLTLMVMPQFLDMEMSLRELSGAGFLASPEIHHALHPHATGGVGDTGLHGLIRLFDAGRHHVHAGVGFSAPTGDVTLHDRKNHGFTGGFSHYGMQLGSGTWDFLPSVTYTGAFGRWSWGAQLSGAHRLERQNESGYRLGDQLQATAWGSAGLLDWLSVSLRSVYGAQDRIEGRFHPTLQPLDLDNNGVVEDTDVNTQLSSVDFPSNYGGHYWEVGFGLELVVPSGTLRGNRVSIEWLEPVMDKPNGFQLKREGTLALALDAAF